MTTQQLADAVGISMWTVKRHMSGAHLPDAHIVAIYSHILGVSPDDLLPRLDSNQQPTGTGIDATDVIVQELLAAAS